MLDACWQWRHLRNLPPLQTLGLLGGTQHIDREQQAELKTWESPVKCQETFLCWGVGEEVIKHWNRDPECW